MRTFHSPQDLHAAAGQDIGTSAWLPIDQDRVTGFGETTEDRQWIHTDPERAATGPFGHTIAHGYLTLSLLVPLLNDVLQVTGTRLVLNYGLNKVRFPAPTPVGAQIRVHAKLGSVADVTGGVQVVWDTVVEIKGHDKPACVAEPVFRYYFA